MPNEFMTGSVTDNVYGGRYTETTGTLSANGNSSGGSSSGSKPTSNYTEQPLFPTLSKDTVAVRYQGASNPDTQLAMHLGVTSTIKDMPYGYGNSGIMNAFNRYYHIFPGDEAVPLKTYVFITRPDCNMDYCCRNDSYYANLLLQHPRVILSLTQNIGTYLSGKLQGLQIPSHHFISWLVPQTQNFPIPDVTIKTYDYEQPFTNFHTFYAGNANDSRSGASASVTFKETRDLEITKLFDAWTRYIHGCTMGEYSPRQRYVASKITDGSPILDYAVSVYIIGTLPTSREIVFMHKTTGMFPTESPLSNYGHDYPGGGNQMVSVNFAGGFPESLDPIIAADFNYNSGCNRMTSIQSQVDFDNPIVGAPFITWNNSKKKYYLRWQKLYEDFRNTLF